MAGAIGNWAEDMRACTSQVALNARVAALQKQLQQVTGVNASLTAELESLRTQRVTHPGEGAHENGERLSTIICIICIRALNEN